MIELIKNEWKGLIRNKILFYVGIFFLLALGLVCRVSLLQVEQQRQLHQAAQQHVREQWDNMGPTNPHGAAHYGTYVFKPQNLMSSVDEGVYAVTGKVLRLEGHVQNEMVFSQASQSLIVSSFGKLKPALIFQYMIPVLLIFLSFSSVSAERESGRLRLLVMQGLPVSRIILYKAFAVWVLGVLMLFSGLLVLFLIRTGNVNPDMLVRLASLFIAYSSFYLIISLLSTYFSAKMKSSTSSLSGMLAIWLIWAVFLPKMAGNLVENAYPLPSRQAFKAAMKTDRAKGIDGHNPSNERKEAFTKKVLAEYQVDSIELLPVNFDGLLMQADEDYGNKVWDKHFGNNYETIKSQKKAYQIVGLINPFMALQNLSMGFSGTDVIHHQLFLKAAEQYRRVFIKALNDEYAYGGSKSGDWGWKADQEFFSAINDFNYQQPSLKNQLGLYRIDILVVLLWPLALIALVLRSETKIAII